LSPWKLNTGTCHLFNIHQFNPKTAKIPQIMTYHNNKIFHKLPNVNYASIVSWSVENCLVEHLPRHNISCIKNKIIIIINNIIQYLTQHFNHTIQSMIELLINMQPLKISWGQVLKINIQNSHIDS